VNVIRELHSSFDLISGGIMVNVFWWMKDLLMGEIYVVVPNIKFKKKQNIYKYLIFMSVMSRRLFYYFIV
jgi:hypothetical protein